MTEAEFIAAVGRAPDQDDLERANCSEAGKLEHLACGVCPHGKPVFCCGECLTKRVFGQRLLDGIQQHDPQ